MGVKGLMVLGGHQLHSLIPVAQFMGCNPFGSLSATRWIILSFLSKPFQFLAILTKACFILLQGNHLSFCTPFHWRTWWLSGLFSSSRVIFQAQGPVVQRPISAKPGLNFNLRFFIPLLKSLFGKIFSVLFKASSSHTLNKKNSTEFSCKAFRSEIGFHTNPGLS